MAMAGESSLRLSLCLLHPSRSVFEARQVLLSLLRPVTLFHPFPAVQPWGTPSASTSTLRPLGALLLPAFCSALAPRRQLPVSSLSAGEPHRQCHSARVCGPPPTLRGSAHHLSECPLPSLRFPTPFPGRLPPSRFMRCKARQAGEEPAGAACYSRPARGTTPPDSPR